MTAFWPTSEPRAPGRGRDEAATEGWLVMERWDDTCSPAARARRWPSPAIFPAGGHMFLTLCKSKLHRATVTQADRKSTRLNSSHSQISYAVFCLKKKNI